MTWALQRTPSYVLTIPVTIANTTVATAIVTGSAPVTQYTGNITNIIADGFIEFSNLAHSLTITMMVGSSTMATFIIVGTDIPGAAITTQYHWSLDARLAPQNGPITTATMNLFGNMSITGPTGKLIFDFSEAVTVNTTITNTFGFTGQWSNAVSTNIFTATSVAVA